MRCLYQRRLSENFKEEEKHLHKVVQSSGYDNATIRAGSKALPSKDHTDTGARERFDSYYSVHIRIEREHSESV